MFGIFIVLNGVMVQSNRKYTIDPIIRTILIGPTKISVTCSGALKIIYLILIRPITFSPMIVKLSYDDKFLHFWCDNNFIFCLNLRV